jgi:hypothetical protein
MGVAKLISAALQPGASLKHVAHKIVPVDALHALALAPEQSSVLIKARLGDDNLSALRAVVMQLTMEVFAQRRWSVPERRKFTRAQTLYFFVEQVWREYLGEPCRWCKGHGYVGRKYDTIRHRLGTCETCHGRGFVLVPTNSYSVETRKPLTIRRPCATCRGKTLVEISEEVKARRLKVCLACWGSGTIPGSLRARAKALHDNHMQIKRVWQERFRVVLAVLREKERDGLIICREYLFGD